MKHYPIMDRLTLAERRALGVGYVASPLQSLGVPGGKVVGVRTGEKRRPKKGEWYLSGAIPVAYRAPNDLLTEFHILKLALVSSDGKRRHKDLLPVLERLLQDYDELLSDYNAERRQNGWDDIDEDESAKEARKAVAEARKVADET